VCGAGVGKGSLSKFEIGAQYEVTPVSTFTAMLLDSGTDMKVRAPLTLAHHSHPATLAVAHVPAVHSG
jgi:hypothetical protein